MVSAVKLSVREAGEEYPVVSISKPVAPMVEAVVAVSKLAEEKMPPVVVSVSAYEQ